MYSWEGVKVLKPRLCWSGRLSQTVWGKIPAILLLLALPFLEPSHRIIEVRFAETGSVWPSYKPSVWGPPRKEGLLTEREM